MSSITQRVTTGAVLIAPQRLEVVERTLPPLGPTDVLVQVTQCGVCASDVDSWVGRTEKAMPQPLGHEPAGIVVDVGADVTSVSPGSPVACWVDGGGFSQELVTDERFCIPTDANCQYPALAEPLSCVVNAVELAAPKFGDDVVIIGAGFMGNLVQLVVQLRGAGSVTVVDMRAEALQRALTLGATHVLDNSSVDVAQAIRRLTNKSGADLSFEVTGVNDGLHLAGLTTRMSGRLCIVGYHQGGTREIRLGHWNWMAFQIANAHFRDPEQILFGMRAGLRLMSNGAVDVAPLVTNHYSLAEITEAFHAAAAKRDGFVKAIIEPNARVGPGTSTAVTAVMSK